MTSSKTYWDNVGSDWDLIGSPLRPCPEDSAIMERLIDKWNGTTNIAAPQAVILGITQEIVTMQWPKKTHILAFDIEPARIQSLWQHHLHENAAALCSNWLSLPLVDEYVDVVVADGSFTLLAFPGEYQRLAREMARILAPGGILVVRLYVAPVNRESLDDIFKDLWDGRIGNFNTFKWRLAMALIDPADFSVSFNEVWEAWHARIGSPEKLAEKLNWPFQVIHMIERYSGCTATRNSYPPLDKICDTLSPFFRLEEVVTPSYQDGERYPTVCFRRV